MAVQNLVKGWEVDGNGSRLCPVVGFGINGVESLSSATRASYWVRHAFIKMVVTIRGG
jgi:hypothetical protein